MRDRRFLLSLRPLAVVLVFTGAVAAQSEQGIFVPLPDPGDPWPHNIPDKYYGYYFNFLTDLEPTPENEELLRAQEYRFGYNFPAGPKLHYGNYNFTDPKRGRWSSPGLPDEPPVTEFQPWVGVDWERSTTFGDLAAKCKHLETPGAPALITRDSSLMVLRRALDQVEFRINVAPPDKTGERFMLGVGGEADHHLPREMLEAVRGFVSYTGTETRSLTLSDEEARIYLHALERLPITFGAELRGARWRYVLTTSVGAGSLRDGPVHLRRIRLSCKAREGSKPVKFRVLEVGIRLVRHRPHIDVFAGLLNTDRQDPEATIAWNQCGEQDWIVLSTFKPSAEWTVQSGAAAQAVDSLWEQSLGFRPGGNTFANVQDRALLRGSPIVIGHYYYVVDARGADKDAGDTEWSKSETIARSSYESRLHSLETTMGTETEVGVEALIKTSTKFSLSQTETEQHEEGSSRSEEGSLAVATSVVHRAGALIIMRIPVLISGGRVVGTDTFTFDKRITISLGDAAKSVQYFRYDAERRLRRVEGFAAAIYTDKEGQSWRLLEEIGGDYLNVVRMLGYDTGASGKNFLAGRWRYIPIADYGVRYVTIDDEGRVTPDDPRGAAEPAYRIEIDLAKMRTRKGYGGKSYGSGPATFFALGAGADKQGVGLSFEWFRQNDFEVDILEGPMGKRSKMILRSPGSGLLVGYFVRVGGAKANDLPW